MDLFHSIDLFSILYSVLCTLYSAPSANVGVERVPRLVLERVVTHNDSNATTFFFFLSMSVFSWFPLMGFARRRVSKGYGFLVACSTKARSHSRRSSREGRSPPSQLPRTHGTFTDTPGPPRSNASTLVGDRPAPAPPETLP